MPPKSDNADIIRVKHMRDAAKEALSFIKDKNRDDLRNDRKLALSLIKEIEIIGEAASKVGVAFRKTHQDIPWDIIIAARNRLIHGYFDVDYGIVWSTVTGELPKLLERLNEI
jgi:uncharacterized protein with HEPN domain